MSASKKVISYFAPAANFRFPPVVLFAVEANRAKQTLVREYLTAGLSAQRKFGLKASKVRLLFTGHSNAWCGQGRTSWGSIRAHHIALIY